MNENKGETNKVTEPKHGRLKFHKFVLIREKKKTKKKYSKVESQKIFRKYISQRHFNIKSKPPLETHYMAHCLL